MEFTVADPSKQGLPARQTRGARALCLFFREPRTTDGPNIGACEPIFCHVVDTFCASARRRFDGDRPKLSGTQLLDLKESLNIND